jgi:ferredoxin
MTLRPEIDKESCLSSGRCVADLPAAFGWDADELAEPLPGAASVPHEALRDAARNCPGMAIHLVDDTGADVRP